MFVKRFVAASLPDATAQIRREMGQDVIILSSRKVRAKGIAGFLGKMVYEVVAAVEQSETRDSELPVAQTVPTSQVIARYRGASEQPGTTASAMSASQSLASGPLMPSVPLEPHVVAATPVVPSQAVESLDATLARVSERLIETGLSKPLLLKFLQSVSGDTPRDLGWVQDQLRVFTRDVLAASGDLRLLTASDRIVGLVGPTGVGKTTTIAKLAARARLKEGRQVGVMTVDTFRVAAVEQMKTYTDILGLPFVAARDAAQARAGLRTLATCDLILVDTTGRNFLEPAQAKQMAELLEPFSFDIKYLVLSLSSRMAESLATAKALRAVGYDALLLTKADETLLPSLALSLAAELQIPLSYMCTGQHVPDDIKRADAAWISESLSREAFANG